MMLPSSDLLHKLFPDPRSLASMKVVSISNSHCAHVGCLYLNCFPGTVTVPTLYTSQMFTFRSIFWKIACSLPASLFLLIPVLRKTRSSSFVSPGDTLFRRSLHVLLLLFYISKFPKCPDPGYYRSKAHTRVSCTILSFPCFGFQKLNK